MLKQRVITALVLAPLMIGGIFFLPLYEFGLFVGAIAAVAAWEWAGLAGFSKQPSRIFYALAMAVAVYISMQVRLEPGFEVYSLYAGFAWWLFSFGLVISYPKSAEIWANLPTRSIIGFIVLIPMWVGFMYLKSQDHSNWLIVYLMLVIWGADTGAYVAGKTWGKAKLAPKVSPGKSWAGFWGGLATAMLVAAVFAYVWHTNIQALSGMAVLKLLVVAAITMLASVLGDLVESMFKRQRGIKDSSNLLPGHGGVLDRIDSMAAAVPVFALLLIVLDWRLV